MKPGSSLAQGVWRLSNELLRADSLERLIDVLFDEGRPLFPFSSAVFFPLDRALFRPIDTGHLGRGIDVAGLAPDYASRYYRLDPLRVVENPGHHNLALRTHDVVARRRYRDSEIWHDFYRPLGIDNIMGICVVSGDTPVCGIGLHREKGAAAFSDADRERLTLLAPAVALGLERLRQREATGRLLPGGDSAGVPEVAVWLLDPQRRALDRNAFAEQLESSWVKTERHARAGFPRPVLALIDQLSRPGAVEQLRRATMGAGSVACLLGDRWYQFTVALVDTRAGRTGPASIVVTATARPRSPDPDQALDGLALSVRERDIARQVLSGQSNKEIASALGIVEQTVKDHLRSIYAKAGVNSRARLIALLLQGL